MSSNQSHRIARLAKQSHIANERYARLAKQGLPASGSTTTGHVCRLAKSRMAAGHNHALLVGHLATTPNKVVECRHLQETILSRIRKDPLRPLTEQERQLLEQLVHARSERPNIVAWARELLAGASGQTYTQAAAMAGQRSNEAVSELVRRFNRDGLAALEPHGKGEPEPIYDAAAREQILAEARRTPDPHRDVTVTWSLMTSRNPNAEAKKSD